MQIAFNEVGRQAIMGDHNWNGGDYYRGDPPDSGLAVARMIGHITYLSDESMHERFGRRLRNKVELGYDFTIDFEVESYLRYQGEMFTRRFDANTYLYITKALDYFDLTNGQGVLVETFRDLPEEMRFLLIAFSSDWLYPPYQSKEIVRALKGNGLDCSYLEMRSSYRSRRLPAGEQGHEPRDLALPGVHGPPARGEACLTGWPRRRAASAGTTSSSSSRCRRESRVLDLGCGRGTLLKMLVDRKGVRGTGIEIVEEKVYDAVAKGVTVYHGDFDEGLSYYPDNSFDYVILSQTLQEARETVKVLMEALRVGRSGRRELAQLRALEGPLATADHGTRAGDQLAPLISGTTRPTCTLSPSRTSASSLREQNIRIVKEFYVGEKGRVTLLAQPAGRERRLRAGVDGPARRGRGRCRRRAERVRRVRPVARRAARRRPAEGWVASMALTPQAVRYNKSPVGP